MVQSSKKLLFPILFFSFLLIEFNYSQSNATPIVVSEESKVALFSQSDARIFPDSDKGFIVSWVDSRNGDSKFFAQKYNPDLSPIGGNFETISNSEIVYSTTGKSFAIYDSSYSYMWFPWDQRSVKIFKGTIFDDISRNNHVILGGGEYPTFIEFWSGEGYSAVKSKNDFISVTDIGGRFQVTKIFSDGSDSLIAQNDPINYQDVSNTSIAINNNGEYAITYLNILDYYEPDSINSSGIYVQIFSNDDTLISKKNIKPFIDYDYYSHFPSILATSISDSLFQIFVSDSSMVTSIIIDKFGNILEYNSFPLVIGNYDYYSWWERNTFTLSNDNGDKRALILTFNDYDNCFKNLFYLDKDGKFIGDPIVDSTSSFQYSNEIFMDENSNLVFTKTVDRDIYLYRCNNFDVIDSIKINDDVSGSNEARPYIMTGENNGFYLYWVNEKNSVGQLLNNTGNLVGENQILQSESFSFFNDGKRLEPWSKTLVSGKKQMGFRILDKDSNLVAIDSLAGDNGSDEIKLNMKIINVGEFLVVYYSNGKNYLAKYSKDGQLINKVDIQGKDVYSNSGIFLENYFFYVKLTSILYKYDYSLNLISREDEFPHFYSYIGQSRFLTFWLNEDYYDQIDATIYNEKGETLSSGTNLGNSKKYKIGFAKSDQFIVFTEVNNTLLANTFNSDGEKIISDFVVHELNNEKVRDLNFEVNSNTILFTWSARKLDEGNYDIYAVVYNLDLVTGIKDNISDVNYNFNLEQNYPNPFNPSTTIQYTIPTKTQNGISSQLVILKVFDIIGREVATLVNKEQFAGNYEIKFNADNMTSGIYFTKLQYGELSLVRKMILLR